MSSSGTSLAAFPYRSRMSFFFCPASTSFFCWNSLWSFSACDGAAWSEISCPLLNASHA